MFVFPAPKGPQEDKDYLFDFKPLTNNRECAESDLLEAAETIVSHTITAPAGITVDSSSLANGATSVQVWLSGGTAGAHYAIECEVVTSNSTPRKYKRSGIVRVKNR